MLRIRLMLLGAAVASLFSAAAAEQDLAGIWRLSTPAVTNVWACPIPGDNASALLAAGALKDPFWRSQEETAQWIGDVDWVFARDFDVPEDWVKGPVFLEFESIDTCARITLNGHLLGAVTNEFRRWSFPLEGYLRARNNSLVVTIASPRRTADELFLRTLDYDIRSWACSTLKTISALRKCQCAFGWDWGVSLPVSGLYRGVRLVRPCEGRRLLRHAYAEARLKTDGLATVRLSVDCESLAAATAADTFEAVFNGETQTVSVASAAVFTLEKPELWWPNGMGAQKLYPWSVTMDGQTRSGRVGIRSLELVREKQDAGESFGFRINGRDFFVCGADWIPSDAFPARRTPARIADLLSSACAANLNCLRVWGGGTYESEAFYDLCDEKGLLVWQDFMFACARYPSRSDFLAEIEAEATYQVRRLRSHPSLLLWCGDNECIAGAREPGRFQEGWKAWNAVLARVVAQEDPTAIWWPSSPCAGPGNFQYNELTGDAGDTHYWGVWHGDRDLAGYYQLSPRFVSEFGYQSYPSLPTVKSFALERDWSFTSGTMLAHQKNTGGNEKINRMMTRYFRAPKDFASHLYLSQVQQALAIETAVAYWRSLYPKCRGAIVWQLNDWWPVTSWSSIEYDGRWKPLHYAMRRFFAADYPAAKRAEELRTLDFKTTPLPRANVRIEAVRPLADATFEVIVRTDATALFVWLEDPEDSATRFDDNLVDLPAGSHIFICTPGKRVTADALKARLTVRDLSGSYADEGDN